VAVISVTAGGGLRRWPVPGEANQSTDLQKTSAAETQARLAELANDGQRVAEALQALAAEREQILARLTALERGLDDVTGTIKRDSSPPRPSLQAAASPPAPLPGAGSQSDARLVPAAPTPAAASAAGETDPAAVSTDGTRGVANPAPPPAVAVEPVSAPANLGIDVGGAINFDGLRTLWSSTKHSVMTLPEELYPVVAVRENGKARSAELRLIVGPLTSAEAAARICATLAAVHRYCQPVAFEGQRLSLAEPLPKPAAASAGTHHPTPQP
jgi:hypothetical protein